MNIVIAARNTIKNFDSPAASRDPYGRTIEHAIWMLAGISMGYVKDEKGHRWLGYAQALIVGDGLLTLKEVKRINKGSDE